mmetsp:Transcript_11118/g.17776  ORF Transcript_11118/g.17776 Transcript_11118/m.17776 type:complete len:513 (+) Transcript_11118:72-1610(+)
MVLSDLGSKISQAIQKMGASDIINDKVVDKMMNTVSLALLQGDVDVKLVKKLKEDVKTTCKVDSMASGVNKRKVIQNALLKGLCGLLDPGKHPFKPKKKRQNVFMFVGLQGSGKTTSCTKLAYYYRKRGWKTALVCADTFRAGAYDQLKQNATKAKVPYFGSYTERDPVVVAEKGVERFKKEKYEIIIVDTSGRHKQEDALFEEMQMVHKAITPDEVIFVMDSSMGQAAKLQATAFQGAVDVGSIIITKLDGHAKGGGALSAVAATGSPITFIGTGEHIDQFERFETKAFVDQLLGMGNLQGLKEIIEDKSVMESQEKLVQKITSKGGEFTFRDMYDQFQTLMNLGSFGKVMSMIPGFQNLMGEGREEQSQMRIKRFMTVMDSMTNVELDSDLKIFNMQPERLYRISIGSGVDQRVVWEVLETFKQFKRVADQLKVMGRSGLDFSRMHSVEKERNIQNLAGAMSPQILQRMGGMQNFANLIKQMDSMGGMSMHPSGGGGQKKSRPKKGRRRP